MAGGPPGAFVPDQGGIGLDVTEKFVAKIGMDVSENSGFSSQIIHFHKVFQYKPSILGVTRIFGNTHILSNHDVFRSNTNSIYIDGSKQTYKKECTDSLNVDTIPSHLVQTIEELFQPKRVAAAVVAHDLQVKIKTRSGACKKGFFFLKLKA